MAASPIAGQEASLRAALETTLWHSYTLTPRTFGSDDGYGATSTPGTLVAGRPCRYEQVRTVRRTDAGLVEVDTPTLSLPWDDTIKVGDLVSAVLDSSGAVLLAGPVAVETITPLAELGPSLLKTATLRGGDVVG